MTGVDWQTQVDRLWDDVDEPGLVDRMAALAAQCPTGDGAGVFELACVFVAPGG